MLDFFTMWSSTFLHKAYTKTYVHRKLVWHPPEHWEEDKKVEILRLMLCFVGGVERGRKDLFLCLRLFVALFYLLIVVVWRATLPSPFKALPFASLLILTHPNASFFFRPLLEIAIHNISADSSVMECFSAPFRASATSLSPIHSSSSFVSC